MDINQVYASIQAQEVNFPVPSTTQTISIGTLKANYQNPSIPWPWTEPYFVYDTPTWGDGGGEPLLHQIGVDEYTHRPIYLRRGILNLGADIKICNIEHLNLRVGIDVAPGQWRNLPQARIEVEIGGSVQSISPSTTEVVFDSVTDTNPTFSITLIAGVMDPAGAPPGRFPVTCLLPMKIDWQLQAAGALTIPVIPVTIIYAPVVDAQKKNFAQNSTSQTSGNVTTFSLTHQNAQQHPISSNFQTLTDVKNDSALAGSVLSKVPIPWVQVVGAALTAFSSDLGTALGSASANQTDTTSVTSQSSLAVTTSKSETIVAYASQGGPGVGDVIIYLKNVKVVWYSTGSQMALALLGYESKVQVTAGQLKKALASISGQNPATLDQEWGLSQTSLNTLLAIDPFVAGGPSAQLLSPRFTLTQDQKYEIGGGGQTIACSHSISSTDMAAASNIEAQSETDSPGMLAFLGIGVTQQQTVSWQITQSNSSQVSNTTLYSNTYTMNADANEHYVFEVYFDSCYGVFAFRSVPVNTAHAVLSGVVRSHFGEVIKNQKVTVSSKGDRFTGFTDENGKYAMRLPGIGSGDVLVESGGTTLQVNFDGSPLGVNITSSSPDETKEMSGS